MPAEPQVARSLLIVEDDATLRSRLARAFRDRGFEVREAAGLDEAAAHAHAETPEYALVDLRLANASGLDVVRLLAGIDATSVIVVLTGYGSIASALEAIRQGAADYLTKPADVDQIVAAFARREAGPGPPASARGGGEPAPDTTPTLARVEWEHINRVLADCDGNISQAARVLGVHRRSLQRKLAKFPLPR